jgi:hypothetical protein
VVEVAYRVHPKIHENLLIASKVIRANRHTDGRIDMMILCSCLSLSNKEHNLEVKIKTNLTWNLVEVLPLYTNE